MQRGGQSVGLRRPRPKTMRPGLSQIEGDLATLVILRPPCEAKAARGKSVIMKRAPIILEWKSAGDLKLQ